MIRRWCDQYVALTPEEREVVANKFTLHNGRSAIDDDVHVNLLDFVEHERNSMRVVNTRLVVRHLLELKPDLQPIAPTVLFQRVRRMCRKKDIVYRARTHIAQHTRYTAEQIDGYKTYVRQQILANQFPPDCVVNIDETNIDFDIQSKCTLDARGKKTISIAGNGSPCPVESSLPSWCSRVP
jgi:hypothetical protein